MLLGPSAPALGVCWCLQDIALTLSPRLFHLWHTKSISPSTYPVGQTTAHLPLMRSSPNPFLVGQAVALFPAWSIGSKHSQWFLQGPLARALPVLLPLPVQN